MESTHMLVAALRFLTGAWLSLAASSAMVHAQDRALAPGLGFTRDFETEWPAGEVTSLATFDDGSGLKLYIAGSFGDVNGHLPFISPNIVRWDGVNWSNVGGGLRLVTKDPIDVDVYSMCVFQGRLWIAGGFSHYYSSPQQQWFQCGVAIWDGIDYSCVPTNPVAWDRVYSARDMIAFDDGSGEAIYFGTVTQNGYLMRWNGQAWSRVGDVRSDVHKFCVHDLGNGPMLFVVGFVEPINGQDPQRLAAWDGTNWSLPVHPIPGYVAPIGLTTGPSIVSVDLGSGPSLFVNSSGQRVLRHQGGAWDVVLDNTHTNNPHIERLVAYDDGNGSALFMIGERLSLPGMAANEYARVARFDGQTWTAVGRPGPAGITYFRTPAVEYDFGEGSDLYIGGRLVQAGGQGGTVAGMRIARYRGVHRPLAAVCGGDGALTRCPCDTRGNVGHGCPSSTNERGARLEGRGVPATDTLEFLAEDLPPSTMTLLFQGDQYAYSPAFTGDGVTCTSGNVLRIGTRWTEDGRVTYPGPGEPTIGARVRALGDPLPGGAVRYYQLWYRDPDPAFCASGGLLNTSNGMRVVW